MSSFRALLDTNVLYPALLRDLLIRLAQGGVFRALWSDEILAELQAALRANNVGVDLQRLDQLMRAALPDAVVIGYVARVDELIMPDAGDRHVLAAAIVGQAAVIVTLNVRDFPEAALAPFGIEVQHPDTFLEHAYSLEPVRFCAIVRKQRQALQRPPLSVDDLLDAYRRMGLTTTAAALVGHRTAL